VENSPDIIARYDRSLRITYLNPTIERVTGKPAGSLVGLQVGGTGFDSRDASRMHAALEQVFRDASVQEVEVEYDGPLGRRTFLITFLPETVVGGTVRSVFGVGHDVTDLRRAVEEANAASKAKSLFLANMSHEIRTPLNGVLGFAQLLETMLGDDHKARDYVRIVRRSGENLLAIVNDILDLARIESGKVSLRKEVFSLRGVLDQALRPLAATARQKGLSLAWSVDPGVPDILAGDPGRLGQVLVNLAGNAVKYSEHGQVTVTVTNRYLRRGGDYELTQFLPSRKREPETVSSSTGTTPGAKAAPAKGGGRF